MKKTAIAAAMLALTVAAAPAFAKDSQRFSENRSHGSATISFGIKKPHTPYNHGILSVRSIYGSLHQKGFRNVHALHYRNGYYFARAHGYRGLVQLTINARSGHVIRRDVIRPYRTHTQQLSPGFRLYWRSH